MELLSCVPKSVSRLDNFHKIGQSITWCFEPVKEYVCLQQMCRVKDSTQKWSGASITSLWADPLSRSQFQWNKLAGQHTCHGFKCQIWHLQVCGAERGEKRSKFLPPTGARASKKKSLRCLVYRKCWYVFINLILKNKTKNPTTNKQEGKATTNQNPRQ